MTAAHPSVPADDAPGEPGPEPAPGRQRRTRAAPESILLDEPSTADLRVKVTEAWQEFARALAQCLPNLPAGGRIDLTLDPTASGTDDAVYSIQWRPPRSSGCSRGRWATPYFPRVSGWTAPRSPTWWRWAGRRRAWSPVPREHFGLLVPPPTRPGSRRRSPGPCVTSTARPTRPSWSTWCATARTSRSRWGRSARRGRTSPHDLDGELDEALAAAVRLAEPDAGDVAELAEAVRTVVSTMMKSNADQVHVDSDGDINIRAGSAMVFVRVRDNPPLVDVFSPVLTQVEPTERLYVKLSELTNRMPIGRLYCTDDTVWASIPVFGRNFQAAHLMLAVQVMTGLADELDDRLHGEFGGKRFFGEEKPVRAEGEHRTGMYL